MKENTTPIFDQERCRKLMEKAGMDLILTSSRVNVGYLSGLFTHQWNWDTAIMHMMEKEYDGVDFLPLVGFPYNPKYTSFLVIYYHQVEAIKDLVWVEDIKGYNEFANGYRPSREVESILLEPASPISAIDCAVEAIEERGLEVGTIGVEICRIPVSLLAELRNRLPKAKFADAFDLLFDLRSIKTPEEINRLRKASDITTKVFREVFFKMLRIGITPYELFQKALELIYEERGFFIFDHMVFGNHTPKWMIDPDKELQKGIIGFLDFGAGYKGYFSDMARMVVMGKANDKTKRIYDAVFGAYETLRRAIKPGVKTCELFKIGTNYLESRGLCPSISLMGHGIGLNVHESPFLVPRDETVIKPGMVISIEPNTEILGLNPFFVEDAGVVTEEGWEGFTSLSRELREILE